MLLQLLNIFLPVTVSPGPILHWGDSVEVDTAKWGVGGRVKRSRVRVGVNSKICDFVTSLLVCLVMWIGALSGWKSWWPPQKLCPSPFKCAPWSSLAWPATCMQVLTTGKYSLPGVFLARTKMLPLSTWGLTMAKPTYVCLIYSTSPARQLSSKVYSQVIIIGDKSVILKFWTVMQLPNEPVGPAGIVGPPKSTVSSGPIVGSITLRWDRKIQNLGIWLSKSIICYQTNE